MSEDRHGRHALTLQRTFERTVKRKSESFRRLCSLGCLLFNCRDTATPAFRLEFRVYAAACAERPEPPEGGTPNRGGRARRRRQAGGGAGSYRQTADDLVRFITMKFGWRYLGLPGALFALLLASCGPADKAKPARADAAPRQRARRRASNCGPWNARCTWWARCPPGTKPPSPRRWRDRLKRITWTLATG